MQLCFSTLVCPNWTLPQIVGAAAAHGIGGVDFRGLANDIDITKHPLFDADLAATLDLFAQHQLQMPCFNTSVTLVSPAPERWQMMLDECHRYAALAGRTGTKLLRIFGGGLPKDMSRAEATILAQRHLRQVVKVCAAQGCCPVVETHDDWSTSNSVMQLVDGFEPGEVGILWDVEHPFRRGESARETADALRPFLRHIHIKDSIRREGKSLPRLLGEGELPLKDLLAAMRAVDYDGWICLETEKRWHPQEAPEPEASVPQFVRFMKENWAKE